jgi:hypothetical protein
LERFSAAAVPTRARGSRVGHTSFQLRLGRRSNRVCEGRRMPARRALVELVPRLFSVGWTVSHSERRTAEPERSAGLEQNPGSWKIAGQRLFQAARVVSVPCPAGLQ